MFKHYIKFILKKFLSKRLPPLSNNEKTFLYELQSACKRIPIFETTNALPSEMAWLNNMNRLRELILNQNPREFLQWDVIQKTMFVVFAKYISVELKYLKFHTDWKTRWRNAIKESPVGRPIRYIFYPISSSNLIHHAYEVAKFEDKTGVKVHELDFAFEFGGGYGSMCRLFYNLGFCGKYVIFDLPLFSALQMYYLKTLGLAVQSINEFAKSETGVVCVSDIQHLKTMLEYRTKTKNIFIATWSISEVPVSIRNNILPLVSDFYSFLIAYQHTFGEVNNLDFFDRWKETIRNVCWHGERIEHIPGNYFLLGKNES